MAEAPEPGPASRGSWIAAFATFAFGVISLIAALSGWGLFLAFIGIGPGIFGLRGGGGGAGDLLRRLVTIAGLLLCGVAVFLYVIRFV